MREVGRELLASFIIVVGWLHALVRPVGEWVSVSVLGAFEEIIKVNFSFSVSFSSEGFFLNAFKPLAAGTMNERMYM